MFNPHLRISERAVQARLALAAVVAVSALAGSAPAQAAPLPAAGVSGPPAQGIIMRDGGICDPIRHMGC